MYKEENAKPTVNPEEVALWGEVPEGPLEPEEEPVQPPEPVAPEEPPREEEAAGGETVIPGTETPAAVQLRKEAGDETPYEPKSLFTHLEEVEVTGDKGLMPVTKKYVIPGKAN